MEQLFFYLAMLGIALLIFLACREITCWYFKINERIEKQNKGDEILQKSLEELLENQRRIISLLQNIERLNKN